MLVRLVIHWIDELENWLANAPGRKAYRKWKKTCHQIPDDEFHPSLELDVRIMFALGPEDLAFYTMTQTRRRAAAHELSLHAG